jgi:hypothetical protein
VPALVRGSSFATFSEWPAIDELCQALELGPAITTVLLQVSQRAGLDCGRRTRPTWTKKTAGRVLPGSHAETPGAGALARNARQALPSRVILLLLGASRVAYGSSCPYTALHGSWMLAERAFWQSASV